MNPLSLKTTPLKLKVVEHHLIENDQPPPKYLAKSLTIAADKEENEMYEIKDVTEHKTMKGVKGFIYKCLWVNSEPTWEPESHIKPTADKLLNQYWR